MKKGELDRLREENARLRHLCQEFHWMARRYADLRMTYAVSMVNEGVKALLSLGVALNKCDGSLYARDGMGRDFDRLPQTEVEALEKHDPLGDAWKTAEAIALLERINAAAEADMLGGSPITGAHHRAIEAVLKELR